MAALPSLTGHEFTLQPVPAAPGDVAKELQRVQKTAQTITSILDLDQLIESIVNETTQWFGCVEAHARHK